MLRAAGYVRVSTGRQAERGVSLEVQERDIRAYCQRQGWELVALARDVLSGMRSDRPGYQAVLAGARAGDVDVIVVWRLDRLGRDEAEHFASAAVLRRAGAEVVSVTEPNGSRLVAGILALVAAEEVRTLARRSEAAKKKLTEEGRHTAPAPYGYRNVGKRLVVEPAEAAIYRRMVAAVEGGASLLAIAHELNRDGIPAPRGGIWTARTINGMLRSPLYAGLVRRRGVAGPVAGQHAPLIPHDRWQALQTRLDRRRRATSWDRSRPPAGLLIGFARCACGAALAHDPRRPPRQSRYYCPRRAQGGPAACDRQASIAAPVLDALVRWSLDPLLGGDPAAIAAAAAAHLAAAATGQSATLAQERARLSGALRREQAAEEALLDHLTYGVIDRATYQRKRAEVSARRAAAAQALAALPPAPAVPDAAALAASARASVLPADAWERAPVARRALLAALGLQVRYGQDLIDVAWRPEVQALLPGRCGPLDWRAAPPALAAYQAMQTARLAAARAATARRLQDGRSPSPSD